MKKFLQKYDSKITGTISTFDRMIFKGHILPFFVKGNRHYFLWKQGVLIKDFKKYAESITEMVKCHCKELAAQMNRPHRYLESSRDSKEKIAREIMEKDKISDGLICVLSCVEPCMSFGIRFNKETKKNEVIIRPRKCLFFYFYYMDRQFGFMHVRLQSWFPFQVQIYINGREWLSKQFDKRGIKYKRYENSFTCVEDVKEAQKIAGRLERYGSSPKSVGNFRLWKSS